MAQIHAGKGAASRMIKNSMGVFYKNPECNTTKDMCGFQFQLILNKPFFFFNPGSRPPSSVISFDFLSFFRESLLPDDAGEDDRWPDRRPDLCFSGFWGAPLSGAEGGGASGGGPTGSLQMRESRIL